MVQRSKQLALLEQTLDYKFLNHSLLDNALTHRSHSGTNNERLEFLGDSILNFIVAELLYLRFPQAPEGDLSRLRAALVRGESLAEIAKDIALGDYLNLGEGELKSGGFRRASILADALEAVIGAIYLDSGLESCKTFIRKWFDSRFNDLSLATGEKDPKSQLQEWLQGRRKPLPVYSVTEIGGDSHNQQFTVVCSVSLLADTSTATATSRKAAEKEAALIMLKKLEQVYG
ncbi:MAG: ribonuclease III [Cellvibrionaceae bacterium]|nr:ribonuclease III [Cellvibrionaceae bacterium]